MPTGTVMPLPKVQFLSDTGDPLAGGLLYAFAAGTSTPLDTYFDSALAVPNANPVVLDAAGRATVYLAEAAYKFVLKTSAGATVWTQDNISSVALVSQPTIDNHICDGRITLTSGIPVTVTDVTAATTIYFTPFKGNRVALFDGTSWSIETFSELSLSLGTDAQNANYDLFLYDNNGTLTLERLAWTNSTTRATGLALQDGVWVKSGTPTRRYLGTYRTYSVVGQTEDSQQRRYVWNYYNRTPRRLRRVESTASWTYTTATLREVNGTTDVNAIFVVIGVAGPMLDLTAIHVASNTNTGVTVSTSIGEDSRTINSDLIYGAHNTPLANANVILTCRLVKYPAIGHHEYIWLEYSAATGTTTWIGVSSNLVQSGISGWIEG